MTDSSSHLREKQGYTGRTTSFLRLCGLLGPALGTILVLFGGGLALGLLQALGYLPASGFSSIGLHHFTHVLHDPDFSKSLILTLYIAITSTLIAAVISVLLALSLLSLAANHKAVHFILQIPLTVPHLVIAIAITLLLAPAGMLSRLCSSLGIIDSPARLSAAGQRRLGNRHSCRLYLEGDPLYYLYAARRLT